MTKTRSSTPKYEVIHADSGTVVSPTMSKTDATKFARNMNEGCDRKRFGIRSLEQAARTAAAMDCLERSAREERRSRLAPWKLSAY